MKYDVKYIVIGLVFLMSLVLSCGREKNPPRDEIPVIKDALGHFEIAVRAKNMAAMDSLMSPEAKKLGYSPQSILLMVYPDSTESTFYSFGSRSFAYVKDKAAVDCFILTDSTDNGRPIAITLVKSQNKWLIKRFDLK